MDNKLPRYKITIDDEYSEDGTDLGMTMIAYTARPAILTKGMAFNAVKPKKQSFNDDLKYRICAPAMIPMDIYRLDDDEEYYVQFTEEEIDKIHSKFMAKANRENVFNLEHNADDIVPAYLLEAWIVEDSKTDKAFTKYGIDVPKGTLMVITQITDKEAYNSLVENEQTGYSIEGFLGMKLSEIINKNKQKQNKMEKLMLPNGEHEIGGKIYVVKENEIIEIKEKEEVIEEVKEEELAEEVKEEELAEEVIEEVKEEELAEEVIEEIKEEVIESYSKEEVDSKFEELYKMIGDLKSEEVIEEAVPEPTQLSAQDRLAAFSRFAKTLKK